MAFSYSFHLSSKSHSVGTIGKIGQVSRHNLRGYESKNYDKNQIEILSGSASSVLTDVKKIYHEEFDDALERYNEGRRSDRQIDDYLQHVSDSRSDVACEIIIQVGDKDFWEDKNLGERKQMTYIFQDQLRSLEKLVPEFKVASAVVHYDEASPHMHVVGVPVATGYKKGMEKQVAKTKVFTADRLSFLQDRMRENAERGMRLPQNQNLFAEMELKQKEQGRNKDIPKESLSEFYQVERNKELAKAELNQINADREREGERLARFADYSRQLTDERRKAPVVMPLQSGEKAFMPIPELERQAQALEGKMEQQASEYSNRDKMIRKLDSQIAAKEEQLKTLDNIGSKMESFIPEIHTAEMSDGLFSKREVTVIEHISPQELELVFQRANIGSDINKTLEEANTSAQDIINNAQEQANNILLQNQQQINRANEILRSESERKRKLDEYEQTVRKENAQLRESNEHLKEEKNYLEDLNGQLERKHTALKTEVDEKQAILDKIAPEVDQKLAFVNEQLTPDQLQQFLNDGMVYKIVQDTMFATCEQLHKQGMLQMEPNIAFIHLDKGSVFKQFKERAVDFITKVKEHILEHVREHVHHQDRGRGR